MLNAACELSYETVKCSPLNATEMMRQGGFEKLAAAFVRCISVVGGHTNDSEPPVKVCVIVSLIVKKKKKKGVCCEYMFFPD